MDEFIKQGQWWWLLIVPLATFVFALFGSWWGTNLGKITEHEQWLRNQKQTAYQKFVSLAQVNAQNFYSALEKSKFSDKLEQENLRMQAYWELHVVANKDVAEEAYRYIHEFKAYITLVQESNVVREVVRQRLDQPEPDDSPEFITGLGQYLKDKDLKAPHDIAVKGYELLMMQVHRLVDVMRHDLGLPSVGTVDGTKDLRSNPVENWLKEFQRTLPEGNFESALRGRRKKVEDDED
ncbi:hypothetical protein AB0323_13350 [Arthrobacter sp. NPDC080031]|uniref:hypothetical protein n=1 Tax=Arthrobacter sp. NPDC080031 TaxID=3155918 RepID=UPI0034500346